MSPRRLSVAQAREEMEQAAARLREAERAEQYESRLAGSEPANRRIVKFSARFVDGGTTYTFVAIRADHYRGASRWFVSQNNEITAPVVLRSPATWAELVQFAIPGTIYVAPLNNHWKPVDPPSAREISRESGVRMGSGLVDLDGIGPRYPEAPDLQDIY